MDLDHLCSRPFMCSCSQMSKLNRKLTLSAHGGNKEDEPGVCTRGRGALTQKIDEYAREACRKGTLNECNTLKIRP